MEIKELTKEFDHTEDNIKALQSVGQIIGEVLKQLDDERCRFLLELLIS
jgi:26S proteasome regulatory subunit T4